MATSQELRKALETKSVVFICNMQCLGLKEFNPIINRLQLWYESNYAAGVEVGRIITRYTADRLEGEGEE